MHLDVVVGETHPGRLVPPDLAHFGSGPSGLLLGFPVGLVPSGVQKGDDAVGVPMLRGTEPLGQQLPARPQQVVRERRGPRVPGLDGVDVPLVVMEGPLRDPGAPYHVVGPACPLHLSSHVQLPLVGPIHVD